MVGTYAKLVPRMVSLTIYVLSLFALNNTDCTGAYLVWSIEDGNLFCRLRSSLWLQFKPHHIAAGAAYLAAKFLNIDLTAHQNIWQEFQTTPTILQGNLYPLHCSNFHQET